VSSRGRVEGSRGTPRFSIVHNTDQSFAALKNLAAYLALRRENVLGDWRRAVDADPST
jgi:hypothetical protein